MYYDNRELKVRHRSEINMVYVKDWLEKFEVMPEYSGVLKKFEKLL